MREARSPSRRKWPARTGISAVASLGLLLAACGGAKAAAPRAQSGGRIRGGTVTYASVTQANFNWLFPFETGTTALPQNTYIEDAMWMPLYDAGNGASPTINFSMSLAYPPEWSNGNRTVTIRLRKGFKWSDGTPRRPT